MMSQPFQNDYKLDRQEKSNMTKRTHSRGASRDRGPFARSAQGPWTICGHPPVGGDSKKDVKYNKTNPFIGRGGFAVMR